MFPPPLRAHVLLIIIYVAAISAAPPINAPPESSFVTPSTPGSTLSGGSANYDSALPHAANLGDPDAFTSLAPGESIGSVAHDPSATYGQSRTGDSSIGPSNPFTYVGANDTPMDLHATIEGIANVKLSDNLVVSRHVHDKRISWRPGSGSSSSSKPRFKRCSSLEKTVLGFASEHAQKLLAEAISSLMPDKSRSSYEAKFELWFGGYSESKGHTVRNNLGRISSFFPFSAFTFGCDCHEHTSPIKPEGDIIKFCNPFWRATGAEQASAFVGLAGRLIPLDVRTFGVEAARLLVLTDPMHAPTNVDNYVAYVMKMKDPLSPNQHPPAPPPPHDPPPVYDPPSYPPPPYNGRQEGL